MRLLGREAPHEVDGLLARSPRLVDVGGADLEREARALEELSPAW